MLFKRIKIVFIVSVLSLFSQGGFAQTESAHAEVAVRMMGHQILLNAGDSTSLVLPIEHSNQTFRIQFATDFSFSPNELMNTVDSIAKAAKIAQKYRVEVVQADSEKIVYSSEVSTASDSASIVPCQGRQFDKAAYSVLFTIVEPFDQAEIAQSENEVQQHATTESNGSLTFLWILAALILFAGGIFWWKKNHSSEEEKVSETVQIGRYRFDERNMKLFLNNNHVDLTSKETDLLKLLYSSVNNTLERDEILKVVWGDEGDYVGRTLDVFISKLRKKISEDENVRIVNVRGVGYKLILND